MTASAPPQPADIAEIVKPRRRLTGVAALVALVALVVIAIGLAAWFRGARDQVVGSADGTNYALADVAATVEVSDQIRAAVTRIYSVDFARLDADEKAVNDLLTGPIAETFHQQFANLREPGSQQHAVVVASVPALAVKKLDGDRATLLVFLDQEARQAGKDTPEHSTGKLSITALKVDGRWKIANFESL